MGGCCDHVPGGEVEGAGVVTMSQMGEGVVTMSQVGGGVGVVTMSQVGGGGGRQVL